MDQLTTIPIINDMNESELIDLETINTLKDMLEDGIFELFDEFIADGPQALEKLESAISQMNSKEIGNAAHYLKGSAGNIGAIALSDACRELESQARNDVINDAAGHLENIKQVYSATIQYMERQGK